MKLKNRLSHHLLAGVLAGVLGILPITVHATPEDSPLQTAYEQPVQSNSLENWPTGPAVHAESAIVMEADTGTILYAKDIEEKNYPASITKILTALVVLENCDLNEEVTFSYYATHSIESGSSSIARTEGEILTVEEALYGLLLASANECANALAEHTSGSNEEFAILMNQKAEELGCVNTHFSNPSGLHDENHYTCAYDMALITQAALQNEDFRRIAGSATYTLRATNKNSESLFMQNHHNMIAPYRTAKYLDDTVFAGKTGYTTDALNTLVTCGTRNGMDVIIVTMRTPSTAEKGIPLFTDTAALLDYAANFKKWNIAQNEQTFLVENAYDFSMESDDLRSTASTISIDESSALILPTTASFTDATSSISFEEHSEGTKAYLTYEYSGQPVGRASILLTVQVPTNVADSENEATEDSARNKPEFVVVNFKAIFQVLLILAVCFLLILLIRKIYKKNRAKIRRSIQLYQKRHFLKRKRRRKRRRR